MSDDDLNGTPPPGIPELQKEDQKDSDIPPHNNKSDIIEKEESDPDGPPPPKKQEMEHEESPSQKNEEILSDFNICTNEEDKNEGIFSVVAVHLYPMGTFKEQTDDKVELILEDSKNTWISFSGDGDMYMKLEDIHAGEVIKLKSFKWNKIEQRRHNFIIPGLDYAKKGTLMENTVIEVLPRLNHLGAHFKTDENVVYSLHECIRSITSFTAKLIKIQLNKNTHCGDVLSLRFLTSDNKEIQLALFGDQSQVDWGLTEDKKYKVSYAKGDKTTTRFASASFYGTPRTTIEVVEDLVQKPITEITDISDITTDTGEVFGGTFWFRDVIQTLSGKRAVALDGSLDNKGFANAVWVEMPINVDISNHAVKRIKFTAIKKGHNILISVQDGSVEASEKTFDPLLAKHRIIFK